MKSLPALVILIATAGLVATAIAAALGVPCSFCAIVLRVSALAWAAGAVAVFVADYAPRHTGPAVEPRRERAPAAQTDPADAIPLETLPTLGLSGNPATFSLS